MANASALFDLHGKVALVTGGSRGLGRAMVPAFARAGADVVISSRKLASCEATAEEVRPDEIVGAALYFASAASIFTTGAVLGIHGGAA